MRYLALIVGFTTACLQYQPPAAPAPSQGTPVSASFGRTWDAVIDHFAHRTIPIRTIDRGSGLIATETMAVGADGPRWADCGRQGVKSYEPRTANYNVLVRGDSARATVLETIRFASTDVQDNPIECSTRGIWEQELEAAVKGAAER